MKSAEEWKAERWEGEDYIITGFGFKHPSVFTRREAVMLVEVLKAATPTIQLDSWKKGMTDAAKIANKYGSDDLGNAQQIRLEINQVRDNTQHP